MKQKLLNFLLFQFGWLAVVLLGAGTYHWGGLSVVAALVAYHLKTSHAPQAELRLILIALALGLVWENLLTLTGVLSYPHGQLAGGYAPPWIIAMWAMLATTLNLSLRWMHGRLPLALAFGAVGGPLAFLAGERLGAVVFPDTALALAVLAIGWALLFALLIAAAMRNDGFAQAYGQARESST